MTTADIEQSFSSSLRIYASLVLLAGVAHGVWHWLFPTYPEMAGLTEVQWGVVLPNPSLPLKALIVIGIAILVLPEIRLRLRKRGENGKEARDDAQL